jgi:hypothetical protein
VLSLGMKVVELPEDSWLGGCMEKLGISVMIPETIENARGQCCNVLPVQTFFDGFSPALSRALQLSSCVHLKKLRTTLTKVAWTDLNLAQNVLIHVDEAFPAQNHCSAVIFYILHFRAMTLNYL